MKVYALVEVRNAEYSMEWAFTKIVFCSDSISKVIDHAKQEYGVVINELDYLELDTEENCGYKVEEVLVNTRNKQ